MKVKGNRLLIEVDEVEERVGSIFIPKTTAQNMEVVQSVGKIIDMGPLCYADSCGPGSDGWDVRVGDRVLFVRASASMVPGEEYKRLRVVEDQDVLLLMSREGE